MGRHRGEQRGSVTISAGRIKRWYGRWMVYLPGGKIKEKCTVLGDVSRMTKDDARGKLADIIRRTSAAEKFCFKNKYTGSRTGFDSVPPVHPFARFIGGDVAELVVIADLMRRGFDVYRPASPRAKSDVLVLDGDRPIHFEVKSCPVVNGRAQTSLYRNAGKFDVLAVVTPGWDIFYVPVHAIDNLQKPLVDLTEFDLQHRDGIGTIHKYLLAKKGLGVNRHEQASLSGE